jgi:hypothetical protein
MTTYHLAYLTDRRVIMSTNAYQVGLGHSRRKLAL